MILEETTASVLVERLADDKEILHMNISTLDRSLKSSIVLAALDNRIPYEVADDLIKHLDYGSI